MDRFIAVSSIQGDVLGYNLKSNMDRFIGAVSAEV